MDDVGKGAYRMADAFMVAMLSAPIAMRGVGFSRRQIVMAVMKAGAVMMVLVFLFGEFVAPASEQWGERHRAEKLEQQVTLKTRYGFWARDGQAFVNIRTILPGAQLRDIFVYEFDPAGRLTLATHADYRGGHWQMFGIRQSQVAEAGIIGRGLAEARWDSLLDPGLLSAVVVEPTMLRIDELYRYIAVMQQNGQAATEYEVAFWIKLATPLGTLVMLFIAIPFVLTHQRLASLGQRVFLGVLLGMSFYLLSRGMAYVAVVFAFSPALSALIPAAAFLAIGVFMMRRQH